MKALHPTEGRGTEENSWAFKIRRRSRPTGEEATGRPADPAGQGKSAARALLRVDRLQFSIETAKPSVAF